MGKNNRQRRAAKARKRHSQHGQRSAAGSGRPWQRTDGVTVGPSDLFIAAAYAERSGDDATVLRAVERLAREPSHEVTTEIADLLEHQLVGVWRHGWQPADLDRAVGRELGKVEGALIRRVIASESASYERLGTRVAPSWMAQLEGIDAVRTWAPREPYLLGLGVGLSDVVLGAVRVMCLLLRLPVLERLTDPPSDWRDGPAAPRGSLPDGVLDKVRALLAKAESTTFEAEADSFTAKAQELMARHRIDRVVLDAAGQARGEVPIGRRIGVDDPYADAKAALLAAVADANGCRVVWSKHMGFSTVFGFADDLGAVEELFTSLLVQSSAALRREGRKNDGSGRSRTTRFRRSFMVAFAHRIGQRLRATVDATVEAASEETGTALVPLLADRDEATRAAAEAVFPEVGSLSPSATDGEGWYAGTLFGDQADLALGPALSDQFA